MSRSSRQLQSRAVQRGTTFNSSLTQSHHIKRCQLRPSNKFKSLLARLSQKTLKLTPQAVQLRLRLPSRTPQVKLTTQEKGQTWKTTSSCSPSFKLAACSARNLKRLESRTRRKERMMTCRRRTQMRTQARRAHLRRRTEPAKVGARIAQKNKPRKSKGKTRRNQKSSESSYLRFCCVRGSS